MTMNQISLKEIESMICAGGMEGAQALESLGIMALGNPFARPLLALIESEINEKKLNLPSLYPKLTESKKKAYFLPPDRDL